MAETAARSAPDAATVLMTAAMVLWVAGMAALIGYSVYSYLKTRRLVTDAVIVRDNIYETDRIRTPFILGLWKPRIYIPVGVRGEELDYVLDHEGYHLHRRDHVVKTLAFVMLAVHWFNPLVWLSFHLMGKDMEMSCDKKVLGRREGVNKAYSKTLLSVASPVKFPVAAPLCSGESSVKSCIKNALRWRRPKVWVTLLAVALSIVVLSACAVNPGAQKKGAKPSGTIVYRETPYEGVYLYHTESAYSYGANRTIGALVDDYDVMSTDPQGRYVVNRSVCKDMEVVENTDGSHTVIVTLQEGLTYCNGEPITAVDYLVSALIDFSPVVKDGWSEFSYNNFNNHENERRAVYFAGAEAYMKSEADTISCLRLIDEHTYAVTIPAERVEPYYDRANVSLRPVSAALYGAAAVVDGQQVTLTGLTKEGMMAGSRAAEGRVSAGPYRIEEYDEEKEMIVLRVNEHYAGNFEGQKPGVETIEIKGIPGNRGPEEFIKDQPDGEISFFPNVVAGGAIAGYQKYMDSGDLTAASYPRSGYGQVIFQCDMGPTQFPAVRRAIACLIDREAFAKEFCQGHGGVVHGPYDTSRWEYRAYAATLEAELDPYAYDPARAVDMLVEDGWVLDEMGRPYVSGVRYKEVTAEQAGDFTHNITLPDGRILMPLIIDRAESESGGVLDPMDAYFGQNQAVTDAGMQVNTVWMSFADLLNYLYREEEEYNDYVGPNTFCFYTLAQNMKPKYDFSGEFVPEYSIFHADGDEELAELSRRMIQAGDDEAYAAIWKDFVLAWNKEAPTMPLYQNVYYDYMDARIKNLKTDTYWPFERAVLYATVEG